MPKTKLTFEIVYRNRLWYVECNYIVYGVRLAIDEPDETLYLDKLSYPFSTKPTRKQFREQKSYLASCLKWEAVLECV